MTHAHYDLYAIGNALVDAEYEVTEAQLQAMRVAKRHMTLIDMPRREALLAAVGNQHARRTGGGSAANTVVALAQLGGKAFYSCRVGDDDPGAFYRQDLANHGVDSNLAWQQPCADPTGACMVMVTPDAERSMNTFLGATADIDSTALHAPSLARSRIYYMEGYLAASPTGLAAALAGRALARQAGALLASTLSDMTMINYCRAGLEAMVGDGLDYLFCNEEEAQTWCDTSDLDALCSQLTRLSKTVCLTRSAKGCVVLDTNGRTDVPAAVVKAIDTNGAGDMFAGAFLYAVTQGHSNTQAAWLANQAAGQVVSQYGNRLSTEQLHLIKERFMGHVGAGQL